jgi:hypothetical protein
MDAASAVVFGDVSYREQKDRQDALIDAAIARFPKEFGLKAFPGSRFRIERRESMWDTGYYHGKMDHPPGPILYVFVYSDDDGKWLAFAKGTPDELVRTVVPLP